MDEAAREKLLRIYSVDSSYLIYSLFFLFEKSLICYMERFSHLSYLFLIICLLSKQISTQALHMSLME